MNLGQGKKGFTAAVVYDYAVLFTTYQGTRDISNDSCDVLSPQSESYFYALEMTNGSAKFAALDGQAGLDTSDRSRKIDLPGLPPAPTCCFRKPSMPRERSGWAARCWPSSGWKKSPAGQTASSPFPGKR